MDEIELIEQEQDDLLTLKEQIAELIERYEHKVQDRKDQLKKSKVDTDPSDQLYDEYVEQKHGY